jgi:hypothetical protein
MYDFVRLWDQVEFPSFLNNKQIGATRGFWHLPLKIIIRLSILPTFRNKTGIFTKLIKSASDSIIAR